MSWTLSGKNTETKLLLMALAYTQILEFLFAGWFWSAIFCSIVITGVGRKSSLKCAHVNCFTCKLTNLIKIFLWNNRDEKRRSTFQFKAGFQELLLLFSVKGYQVNVAGHRDFSSLKSLLITPGINCIKHEAREPLPTFWNVHNTGCTQGLTVTEDDVIDVAFL